MMTLFIVKVTLASAPPSSSAGGSLLSSFTCGEWSPVTVYEKYKIALCNVSSTTFCLRLRGRSISLSSPYAIIIVTFHSFL